jgi:hypothetical protein
MISPRFRCIIEACESLPCFWAMLEVALRFLHVGRIWPCVGRQCLRAPKTRVTRLQQPLIVRELAICGAVGMAHRRQYQCRARRHAKMCRRARKSLRDLELEISSQIGSAKTNEPPRDMTS